MIDVHKLPPFSQLSTKTFVKKRHSLTREPEVHLHGHGFGDGRAMPVDAFGSQPGPEPVTVFRTVGLRKKHQVQRHRNRREGCCFNRLKTESRMAAIKKAIHTCRTRGTDIFLLEKSH